MAKLSGDENLNITCWLSWSTQCSVVHLTMFLFVSTKFEHIFSVYLHLFFFFTVTSMTSTNCPMVWWVHSLKICISSWQIVLILFPCNDYRPFFLDVPFYSIYSKITICDFPIGFKACRTFSYDIITIVARLLEGW